MSIKKTSLGLSALILLGAYCGQVAADDPSAQQRLLGQIQLGESLYREDIVQDAVARLYRIVPDHPDGLGAELRQAIRLEQTERAQQLLDQLASAAPASYAYRSGRVLLRLTTPAGQQDLAQARLFSAAGRIDEARLGYDTIFEGVYPSTDLALEYWQLRARQPGGRPLALKELISLLAASPQHAGVLTVAANYSFAEDQPDQARGYLHQLALQPLHREQAASREYDYLATLPVSANSAEQWSGFVDAYRNLTVAEKARQQLQRQQALLGDAAWQGGQKGLQLLDAGHHPQALQPLQKAVLAYPDNAALNGALGMAYLRSGNRQQALHYFQQAKDTELHVGDTSKWVSLIQATRYWLLLQNASVAAERQEWTRAQQLYTQANQQDPSDVFALVGLGDTAIALEQHAVAWRYFKKALMLAPGDTTAQRGVARYLATQPPHQALQLLDQLPASYQQQLLGTRRTLQLSLLQQQAEQAQEQQQWQIASTALTQAQELDPDDPWLSYRLALALRHQGLEDEALKAFQTHMVRQAGAPASHYAHALLLSSADRWQDSMDTLHEVNLTLWTPDMQALLVTLQDNQHISHANTLYDAGRKEEAVAWLENRPDSDTSRMRVADWSLNDGHYAKALSNYAAVLRRQPDHLDARLGQLETWAAQGKLDAVRYALMNPDFVVPDDDVGAGRQVAALWVALGDKPKARQLLQQLASRASSPNPVLFRDLARVSAEEQPQLALDLYAKAMQDAAILPAGNDQASRDNVAFTRATREQDSDDWLRRSIRREAATLYVQETPTLTLHNDVGWRRDGTPGLSKLNMDTTMLHLDYPVRQGKAYLRADYVRMSAGTFETGSDGAHDTRFGTCDFAAQNVQGQWESLPACKDGLKQKSNGTSVALGWQGERLAFDIGRTPQGFPISNWVGGVSYRGDLKQLGWTITASRRPMSNSLLSFAGTQDPRTGITWGGVIATGLSLGLSWDQGEKHGVWADISHHKLTGKNVADNHRTRLMAGYYHRLVNKADESLIVGVNVMHWRHQKDLGEYTLGQGGYYSPQRYSSVSLPISYARRTANWSFLLEAAVSASRAKSNDSAYYPLAGLVSGPMQQLHSRGVSSSAFNAANTVGGGSSNGIGYSLRGVAERRLSNHWVVGGGIDWQHSKDYAPSRFMLYLRYSFEPWQGNLPLRPTPLTPYADFK